MIDSGALPAGWSLVPLGELLTAIDSGKSFKCEERPPEAHEVGVIKVSAVSWGEYQESESKTCVDAERIEPDYFVRPGDFLFSRANTIELVGACVIAGRVSKRLMLSDKILRLHFAMEDLKPWVLQYLRSKAGRDQIEMLASGNQESMRNIGQERLRQILVPLPPSNERESIGFKLDELLSQLAAASYELSAGKRKLGFYRQSLLKSAVEGTLTAEWRRQSHPLESGVEALTRVLNERARAANREPMEPDLTGAPPLPDGWAWASLDQLLCSLRSGTAETSGRATTPYPVLKSSAVRHGSIDYTQLNYLGPSQSRAENFLATGDLLVTRLSGSVEYVGCAAVVESEQSPRVQYPDRVFCVRPVSGAAVLTPFVVLCFEAGLIRGRIEAAAKSTAGHKRISMSDLRPLPIPIPPLEEVVRIVEACGAALESAHELARDVDRQLALIAAQRQNILRAAFSGQLVPQDPSDEPASVLLDRIRTQRQPASPAAKPGPGRPAKVTA